MLNKPKKPDYTIPKAYRPIALMECAGKLLEKIVAKRINSDIQRYDLLPMTQFRSRPQHNTLDAIATLVHKIQGTLHMGHSGALILFDISSFFDSINPDRAVAIMRNKGFPEDLCTWTQSFLTGREASIKIQDYVSDTFPILGGTPQGSPLSPILSALYTSSLLEMAKGWEHSDLSLYVDDGAIYSVSKTVAAATTRVTRYHGEVLTWLQENRLNIDPSKSELITFTKPRSKSNLTGGNILGTRFQHEGKTAHIRNSTTVRYLGVYLNHCLNWSKHVEIMATKAQSDIRGLSIFGNLVCGLNFLNWRKAYNAIVIPAMTYRCPIWYTGKGQKSLVQRLQTAQNEGICHMTGVFRTTPVEALHNLTRILPIEYTLRKLTHAYTLHLQNLPGNTRVRTILSEDRCRYWPNYVQPHTILTRVLGSSLSYYPRVEGRVLTDLRNTPRFTYVKHPTKPQIATHRAELRTQTHTTLHIIISAITDGGSHVAIYDSTISKGTTQGHSRTQALSRAVYTALRDAIPLLPISTIIWI
jgi:hypothetical protein